MSIKSKKLVIVAVVLMLGATWGQAVNYSFAESGSAQQSASSVDFDIDFSDTGGSVTSTSSSSEVTLLSSQSATSTPSILSVQNAESNSYSGTSGSAPSTAFSFSSGGSSSADSEVNVVSTSVSVPFSDLEFVGAGGPAKLPGSGGHEEPWPPISDGLFVLLAFALGYVGVLRSKRRN